MATCTLPDGRTLAYTDSGDADGVVVFAFHGMGSSHLTWSVKAPLTDVSELVEGVRLIAMDRPGYGSSSSPPAGYSYAAFADDCRVLADALGVRQFAVLGHSSGGPYALAAAALLPGRVTACAAVSSDPPYYHPEVPLDVLRSDGMASMFYGTDPGAKVAGWRRKDLALGRPDKAHAWKQGEFGFLNDFTLERTPWSFRIEAIELRERCCFWVGACDHDAMRLGTPWMQSLVSGSKLVVVEGGGHGFKKEAQHYRKILEELRNQSHTAPAYVAPDEGITSTIVAWILYPITSLRE